MPAIEGPKPDKTVVVEDNIPKELKKVPSWCLWRYVDLNGKWTKPPISPKTGRKCSYKDAIIPYDKAIYLYLENSKVDGIGFVPGEDDPYICLDLDTCVFGGEVSTFAKQVIKASGSYSEISPSGKGVRILVKGQLAVSAEKGKAVNGPFEAFESVGYCTITGNRVSKSKDIANNPYFMRAVNEGFIQKSELGAVISALFHIENDDLDYDDWLNVMMALHSYDSSFLWLGELWSSLSSKYEEDVLPAKWESFDPAGGLSVKYIFSKAEEAGWKRPEGMTDSKPALRNVKYIDKNRIAVIPVEDIYKRFLQYSDKMWCENGSLVYESSGEPVFLSRATDFNCYLHERFLPDFSSGKGISSGDFFTYVKRKATPVKSVETAPFYPPVPGLAYIHGDVTPGDGSAISEWLDQWSFATICDRWLCECMIYTLAWGGPPGKRPLFVIMSEGLQKHGSGKTSLAEQAAALISGEDSYYEYDSSDRGTFAQEMGVERRQSKRVVLLDNINGSDLQGKKLDKLVTASDIKARRMYVGPVTTPNLFTWIATLNHGKPHQDTASRTIVIRLEKPAKYAPLKKFDRAAIWADIKAFFLREAVMPSLATRRPEWDIAIAGRCEDPDLILSLINDRAAEIDGTRDDAADWYSLLSARIAENDLNPEKCACWISTRDVMQVGLANGLLRSGTTSAQVGQILEKLAAHLPLKSHRKKSGRGWLWVTDPSPDIVSISE